MLLRAQAAGHCCSAGRTGARLCVNKQAFQPCAVGTGGGFCGVHSSLISTIARTQRLLKPLTGQSPSTRESQLSKQKMPSQRPLFSHGGCPLKASASLLPAINQWNVIFGKLDQISLNDMMAPSTLGILPCWLGPCRCSGRGAHRRPPRSAHCQRGRCVKFLYVFVIGFVAVSMLYIVHRFEPNRLLARILTAIIYAQCR